MKDKLERFVRDHRDEFDALLPSAGVWEKINAQLEQEAGHKLRAIVPWNWKQLLAAAATVVLIGSAFLLLFSRTQSLGADDQLMAAINEDSARLATHYAQLIGLKKSQLEKVRMENPVLYRDFAGDVAQLEKSNEALRRTLPDAPNREVVFRAIIKNLQLQTGLLTRQLEIISRFHSRVNIADSLKNNSHESIRI